MDTIPPIAPLYKANKWLLRLQSFPSEQHTKTDKPTPSFLPSQGTKQRQIT